MKEVTYYSVFDSVAQEYGPLFPAVNDGVAKRVFRGLLIAEKVDPQYFDDYELYQIGDFDDVAGEFDADNQCVCNGKDVMEVKS